MQKAYIMKTRRSCCKPSPSNFFQDFSAAINASIFLFRIEYTNTKSCCAELDPVLCSEHSVQELAETKLGRLRGVENANLLVP